MSVFCNLSIVYLRYILMVTVQSVTGVGVPKIPMISIHMHCMCTIHLSEATLCPPFFFCYPHCSFHFLRGCLMYDHTPLTPEELSDQCCALAFAIIRLEHPYAEELLMYVLWERINTLNVALTTEVLSDE